MYLIDGWQGFIICIFFLFIDLSLVSESHISKNDLYYFKYQIYVDSN